jgi:hypothetical protein
VFTIRDWIWSCQSEDLGVVQWVLDREIVSWDAMECSKRAAWSWTARRRLVEKAVDFGKRGSPARNARNNEFNEGLCMK